MSYATVVRAVGRDWLGRGYIGSVMSGTIHSYYPRATAEFRRWTPQGAKHAGDRHIARRDRAVERRWDREQRARAATGYEEER